MDIEKYSLQDLILSAIKSEIDSYNVYKKTAENIKNGLLEDKLLFLAKEEKTHRQLLEKLFKKYYPDKKLEIPEKSVVPMPEFEIPDEDVPLSKVLKQAMEAEKFAQRFYQQLSKKFTDEKDISNMLEYFADMERGHYRLLENEKESMERFEQADVYWPMVHAGP